MKTIPGADIFISDRDLWPKTGSGVFYAGNQASFNRSYEPVPDALLKRGFKIDCLIAPEHGIYGFFQDMETFGGSMHPYLHIPVISLYNSNESSLDIDKGIIGEDACIIYDIQDIGSRYYTFMWTLFKLLVSLSGSSTEIIILDRPNPVIPFTIMGPPIEKSFESFVGGSSIPIIYGLTIGEFAQYMVQKHNLDTKLTIIAMKNYSRDLFYDQTGIPWGFPSPNMPTLETALLYPGGCLLEGTNISEGRGTTKPFSIIGAPYIEADILHKELKEMHNPGVLFKPLYFRPMFGKHSGQICGGLEIAISDRKIFKPVIFYLNIIGLLIHLYPNSFEWRTQVYEYRDDLLAFDMLMGSGTTRKYLERGVKTDIITGEWMSYELEYKREIQDMNIIIYR